MPALHVELDPRGQAPLAFAGDTAPLVYFLSFAYAARFGAQHELTEAARRLRGRPHQVDLAPLLRFADRDAEDEADEQELARLWQDAAPLAVCCRRVVEAIDADDTLRELLASVPTLRDRIEELGRIAADAAARGARVRLTYEMG
jgi:hypothetical protein